MEDKIIEKLKYLDKELNTVDTGIDLYQISVGIREVISILESSTKQPQDKSSIINCSTCKYPAKFIKGAACNTCFQNFNKWEAKSQTLSTKQPTDEVIENSSDNYVIYIQDPTDTKAALSHIKEAFIRGAKWLRDKYQQPQVDWECEWGIDEDMGNSFETGCGNIFIIIDGTPKENKMKYCPYCGKIINTNTK